MQNVRYCNNGDTGFRIIAESPNTNDFSLCYLPLAVCQVPLFFCVHHVFERWRHFVLWYINIQYVICNVICNMLISLTFKILLRKYKQLKLANRLTGWAHWIVCSTAAWCYLSLFLSAFMLTDKTVNTESMRSDSHVRVKLGCCIVSSRNSESCLFLLRHVQNSSCKWPEDSHMDIMPAFHYSFNFCICRICYRHEDTNRWGAVSFLCTLFLSRSLSLPRCLDFSHPGFLWQSQLKRRHWSGHRLRAPYLNRNLQPACV